LFLHWLLNLLSLNLLLGGGSIDPVKFGDAVGIKGLNFLTYIVGGVPDFLIENTNNISASIIIFIMFVMLAFTFSDILSLGIFSKSVAAVLGIGLAVIVANMKFLMGFSYWAFVFAAGFGVVSTIIGILAPFSIFIFLNIALYFLSDYAKAKGLQEALVTFRQGIEGIKTAGKSLSP